MNLKTVLALGRVSNLPTIWTNVLAGIALSGKIPTPLIFIELLISMSLFYTGGMFLNDAFDAKYDTEHQPFRPISSGKAKIKTVFFWGFAMLAAGLALLVIAGHQASQQIIFPFLSGLFLAICIILYDKNHKENNFAPVIMGLCRGLVIFSIAVAVGQVNIWMLMGALILWAYTVGISFAAKHEAGSKITNLWPFLLLTTPIFWATLLTFNGFAAILTAILIVGWIAFSAGLFLIPKQKTPPFAVAFLIAGICLIDAAILGIFFNLLASCVGFAMMVLTLTLQKYVRGT